LTGGISIAWISRNVHDEVNGLAAAMQCRLQCCIAVPIMIIRTVISKSHVDLAPCDAFRKTRRFLMETRSLTEDEAISLISVAVDFSVSQVVDGNWGVHAVVKKALFCGGSL
jgi:acetamidase/formamidase